MRSTPCHGVRRTLFVLSLVTACDSGAPAVDDAADAWSPDAGAADTTAPDAGLDDLALAVDVVDAFTLPPPPTTVKATVQGVLPASKGSNKILFGQTKTGPGKPWLERDDLKAKQNSRGQSTGPPVSLFFLVQMSDMHIIDEESPLRLVKYDALVQSAYRMNEMFNGQALDAMIRTVNRLGDFHRPFDDVVFTGDLIDNNQNNELGWFIDILDGKMVDPDSGQDDDPLPGPNNDPNDSFQAKGLRPTSPGSS